MGRKVPPTQKQQLALQYISQGLNKKNAMIKAGYSPATARVPSKLMRSKNIESAMERLQHELVSIDVTIPYLAQKIKSTLEAKKDTSEDYTTQLQGLKMAKDILIPLPKKNDDRPLKRKLTIEEFLNEGVNEEDTIPIAGTSI